MTAPGTPRINWSDPLPRSVHGTSIAHETSALLLVGPSGTGKSSIALQLLAYGAELVSDDLTQLTFDNGDVLLSCPSGPSAPFGVEARGIGLLSAPRSEPAKLRAIVDLGRIETQRLPEPEHVEIAECQIPILKRVDTPAFPAMLWHYLKFGLLAA